MALPSLCGVTRSGNIRADEATIIRGNAFLRRSFEPRFISGFDYAFTYQSDVSRKGSSWYFKGGFEESGNLLWLVSNALRTTIRPLGIEYSQFVRLDADVRWYQRANARSSFATRLAAGYGVPFGNSANSEIPFSRQFYIGGANSVRAWNIRRVGPGSSKPDESTLSGYQTGDTKLELSSEYRFDIFEVLKGALFVDMGQYLGHCGG